VTRVAAVDLGTNSTRLLVADVVDGVLVELYRETRITRLAERVDAGRVLLPAAVGRVHACLADYRRTIEALGAERTLAVGTSAVRDASNGREFLAGLGLPTRLLTGDEEAALTFRGVGEPDALVVDIGGGSTELVGPRIRLSLELGCVRLSERFLRSDPPSADELEACAAAVRTALPDRLVATRAIGVAGTFVSLAALAGQLTSGSVAGQVDRLAALTIAERRLVPDLEPARASVIVGGALIVRELLARLRLPVIEVSERDLLDGVGLELAEASHQAS
jgi:exopolyphosphatase/guanosine-5'-triphosphate,3'-diphosphate pyrophosphatase